MGSLSRKDNDKAAKNATNQAVAMAQPKNYEDPFGKLADGKFTPVESQTQINTRTAQDEKIGDITNLINPDEFNVEELYNNQFYDNMKRMYGRVIDDDYEREERKLTDNLNARNQIGSSYDAMMRGDMTRHYSSRRDQAEDQARQASAGAWQQMYQNALAGLQGLSGERSAALERTYAPAKIALGYQQAVAPLQAAQANAYMNLAQYYGQRPTFGTMMPSYLTATGNLLEGLGSLRPKQPVINP